MLGVAPFLLDTFLWLFPGVDVLDFYSDVIVQLELVDWYFCWQVCCHCVVLYFDCNTIP